MKEMVETGNYKEKVISLFCKDKYNIGYLVSRIDDISKMNETDSFYSNLLEIFIHIKFEEKEAKKHWDNITNNYSYLKDNLDRDVGIQLAMFDYFININKLLDNPSLIDIHFFHETENLAMTDSLTGLFNRRYLDMNIESEINRAERYNDIFAVMMLDIDNFKNINDKMGHVFGDKILIELSKILKDEGRQEDIICRYGGEEFLIIFPKTTAKGAFNYGERIRHTIRQTWIFKKNNITISGGISSFPYDGKTTESLIRNADKSLYSAKHSGKDCIITNNPEKRRFSRYNILCKLIYQPLEKTFTGNKTNEVFTQNISIGGVKFKTVSKFSLDTKLLFKIKIPQDEEIIIVGKVTRKNKIKDKLFNYGIKFYDIHQEQINKMKKFLPEEYYMT